MKSISVKQLIEELDVVSVEGVLPDRVRGITQDSRLVESEFIFAVRKGGVVSGEKYISQAVSSGAVLIVTAEDLALSLIHI